MPGQRTPTGLAVTRDNVDNTGWNTRFFDQPAELQHRRTGMFRGFEHHGIARGQSRAKFNGHQEKLRVPRHHSGHHAKRFTLGKNEHVGLVDRQGLATYLVRTACEKVEELRDIFGLPTGFFQHLARVNGLRAPQPLGLIRQQITQFA